MKQLLALSLFLAAPVLAQDSAKYNQALAAFNAGDYPSATLAFYELEQNATQADVRGKAQYYLADSFFRQGMPVASMIYFANIVRDRAAKQSFYLKAVEGLVNVQSTLNDEYLIPSALDKSYQDDWAKLPPEVLAHINYLVGMVDVRNSKFEEAKSFLESVGPDTSVYAKAQYLLGITLVDPRYPGGAKPKEAVKAFETVVNLSTGSALKQADFEATRQLAMIALGRTYYGTGQYDQATHWYEQVPRFSKFWDQALFENGWARFQNDDFGGALGSLQSLHAPQFAASFQPESWVLKATVYYFSCLYDEAKSALKSYEDLYLPMAEKLQPFAQTQDKDTENFYRLLSDDTEDKLPRAVVLWVRNNERLVGILKMIKEIDAEKEALNANASWKSAKLSSAVSTYLDSNRSVLTRVAGKVGKLLVAKAYRDIKGFTDNAEIIRFETSKAEKEMFESGTDQKALLAQDEPHILETPLHAPLDCEPADWPLWLR